MCISIATTINLTNTIEHKQTRNFKNKTQLKYYPNNKLITNYTMRKFTLMFFALLLATVGAWAQTTATTEWIDYTQTFNNKDNWTNSSGAVLTNKDPWGCKGVSTAPSPYTVQVTLETADGSNNMAYGTKENYKRPWLKGGYKYKLSVPEGYMIAAYEVGTQLIVDPGASNNTYDYTIAGGNATSGIQSSGEVRKITITGLNTREIFFDLANVTSNNALFLYTLRLKLSVDNMDDVVNNTNFAEVVINVQNSGDDKPQYIEDLILPVGSNITLKDYVPGFSFVTYGNETGNVQNIEKNIFTLTYTVDKTAEANFPFATSYDALTTENKWVSMFTKNGRMHVYDADSEGNVYEAIEGPDGITYNITSSTRKYPTIDKATFTRLNGGFFWGFVRESRFKPTYIVNKGAGNGKYLYLKVNGADTPLLCADETGSGLSAVTTREWIIEKGKTATEDGQQVQYYGVKAVGTSCYINNYKNHGYMTTWTQGPNADDGSNIKFTPELETYEILKARALTAPCNAVHSLDAASRDLIKGIQTTEISVNKYNEIINEINTVNNGTGFIEFVDGGYYYLRNYTPATESDVYVLGSDNGTSARTFTVPSAEDNNQAGTPDAAMTYSNINAIWQISTSVAGEAPGTGIGASRTIAREVTHVNSGKKLTNAATRTLTDTGARYYFVELGAGQHFMKNVQYNGSGQQAAAKPLSCTDGGDVQEGPEIHKKNTRDTWYGIQVKSIDVEIGSTGYATIYLPFGVTLPTGEDATLEAYAVTGAGDGVATLTSVTSIPANQGVILKGKANKTYTLTIDGKAAWDGISNLLKGSCMAENVSGDAYVLSQPAGKPIGLYKAEKNQDSGNAWYNNSNKAYLLVDDVTNSNPEGNGRFLSFNFDTVTGLDVINGAEPASTESVVYDLSGRRVLNAQKGLYIVNGKKVIK